MLPKDIDARKDLVSVALDLLKNEDQRTELSQAIGLLAKPNACKEIVDELEKIKK